MRKAILAATLVLCLAGLGMAQSKDDKYEVFAGFSIDSINTGLGNSGVTGGQNRDTGLGFETSGTGFFWHKLGIEGDFDGHFKGKTFTSASGATTISTTLSTFNFLGGPHYKFSSSGKVTPFVHALLGGNHSSMHNAFFLTGVGGSETDFAMKFGGGVDIGWTKRAAIRLGADYNPVFEKSDGDLNPNFGSRRTRNDAIFSVGIVFK
jgi:Outer membrane protein beta-barrel domain